MLDNGKKMIASLALFRRLYKNESNDILVLLGDFIKLIIKKNNLYSFSASEIKNRLLKEYDFSIPESVVETTLRKICNKKNGEYSIKKDVVLPNDKETSIIKKSNDELIDKLTQYIEEKTNVEFSSSEREILIQSFCEFIIEDTTQVKYAEYISAFIIENQNNTDISEQLRTIKEGVILYTGIKYNDNIAEIGSWNYDFTIYLEQEMLFHFIGYNGDLYKRLFDDFLDLVNEVNRKAKKDIIKLKYFPEVENNINKFFTIAQRIADGKETLDPSNTAMGIIVNGCCDGTDVITKKSQFFDCLKKSSINKSEEIHISDKYNIPYNLYTTEKEDELKQKINDNLENIQQSFTFVNYINVCRKSKMSSLERSKCILLTGNNTTLKIDASITEDGYVPYATTLDFITNRIWRKLNKGFGDNKYPKSFDVVTKAQIVLSSHVIGSISKEFEDLKQKLSNGTITKDIAARDLVDLRSQVLRPEEIDAENTNQALLTISDIERTKRELDNQRNEYEITHKKLEITEKEKKRTEQEKDAIKNSLRNTEEKLLFELRKQLDKEEKKKEKADKTYKIVDSLIHKIYGIAPTIFVIIIVFLIYHYKWDIMEKYTYILSLSPYVFQGLLNLIFGKNIKSKYLLSRISNYTKCQLYKRYNVDESEISRLTDLINTKYKK